MGYNYSYPTYNPTYKPPSNHQVRRDVAKPPSLYNDGALRDTAAGEDGLLGLIDAGRTTVGLKLVI